MILPSDVIRELLKYTAFFQESFVQIGGKYRRSWRYKDDEPSFLAGKVVFVIEPQIDNTLPECRLFDYSPILTAKITDENYLDFVNSSLNETNERDETPTGAVFSTSQEYGAQVGVEATLINGQDYCWWVP